MPPALPTLQWGWRVSCFLHAGCRQEMNVFCTWARGRGRQNQNHQDTHMLFPGSVNTAGNSGAGGLRLLVS